MKASIGGRELRLILGFVLVTLAGCASMPGMPGYISEKKSSFDGSVELSMVPAMVYRGTDGFSGSDVQLALFWRSSMKPGELILEASYGFGAQRIATADSLHFRIDGEIVSFTSIDQLTDFKVIPGGGLSRTVSSKRYLISRQFLDRILAAKDVRVRLDLGTTYVEGIFSDNTRDAAKSAFLEFARRAESLGSTKK